MLNAETMLPASVCNFPLLCLVFALVGQNIHCLQVDYWCTGVVGFYQTHSQWKLISQLMWVWVKPLVLPLVKSWPQFFFFFLCVLFVCFFFFFFFSSHVSIWASDRVRIGLKCLILFNIGPDWAGQPWWLVMESQTGELCQFSVQY